MELCLQANTPNQLFLAYCLSTFCSQINEHSPLVGIWNQLPLHVDSSPYVPMPLVIYFIFCIDVRVHILFFFNLGLNLGAVPRMGR